MNKSDKKNNSCNNNIDGRLYFIKPFDIQSSYISFEDTWETVNEIYNKIDEVSDVRLFRSVNDNSQYGFVSFSKWDSKDAFIKTNSENAVLNFHNKLNGSAPKSAVQNLFKMISRNIYKETINNNHLTEIVLFKNVISPDKDIISSWNNLCEFQSSNYGILSSVLYKSVYKKSFFRFIGIIHSFNTNINGNTLNKYFKKTHKDCKIYYSLFSTIKKMKFIKS